MRPWHFNNCLVDPLEPNQGPDPDDLQPIEEALERIRTGKALTGVIPVEFNGPVPTVPGKPGHRIEYYSPKAVESWELTSLDPVITACGLEPSRRDFEDVPYLCYNSYDRGCLRGAGCDDLHKYWYRGDHDESFQWTMRHLPCRRIDEGCSESHNCMFGHHVSMAPSWPAIPRA